MEAKIEVDNSFENYVPPVGDTANQPSKEEQFANAVRDLAKKYDVKYFVATRNGIFNYDTGDSEVLKAIAGFAWETNNKPENVPMNN
jgi:hypothetical protein